MIWWSPDANKTAPNERTSSVVYVAAKTNKRASVDRRAIRKRIVDRAMVVSQQLLVSMCDCGRLVHLSKFNASK